MDKSIKYIAVFFFLVISLLLGYSCYLQQTILNRMPPTIGEIRNANQDERMKLILKKPAIATDIASPLEVEITNTPLEVEIGNTPIEVEISR